MEPEGSLPHSILILSQLDPVHVSTSNFLKSHLNIFLPPTPGSSKWSLSLKFPHQNPVYTFPLPHTCFMPHPAHSSRFNHPNNTWWAVQIIKLIVMWFCPLLCYLVPLRCRVYSEWPGSLFASGNSRRIRTRVQSLLRTMQVISCHWTELTRFGMGLFTREPCTYATGYRWYSGRSLKPTTYLYLVARVPFRGPAHLLPRASSGRSVTACRHVSVLASWLSSWLAACRSLYVQTPRVSRV